MASRQVTDILGTLLDNVNVLLVEGTESFVLVAIVPCEAGRYLTASDDPLVRVLVRVTGSESPFVDIATTPFDLTPFDGDNTQFDFKLSAGAVAASVIAAVRVRVTPNP